MTNPGEYQGYPGAAQNPQQNPQPAGYPPAPPGYGYAPQQRQGNGLAIAGMVCGIISLLFLWIILGPLAIIFGSVGLARANRGAPHRGMAIAGIVLGIVAIVGYIILIAVLVNDHNFVL